MAAPSFRKRHILCVSAATTVAGIWSSAALAAPPNMSVLLGAANINATYYLNSSKDVMNDAQSQLDAVGSHTEKLELDQYDLNNTWSSNASKYAWNSNWPALNGSTSLVTLASLPPFTKALSDPAITSYDLTTYSPNIPGGGDGTGYWANGITTTQENAETTSFFNLTKYLMQTYTGTGKSFYLSNWEGDGALVDAMPNGDVVPPPAEVTGMIDWLNARQLGITEARNEYASEYPNVHVYGTVEVNHVEAAMQGDVYNGQTGFATVTNDVLPHTTTDFVSYSSYDTQKNTSGTYSYANAVAYVASMLPSTAVYGATTKSEYVGEFGLAENYSGAAGVNSMMNNVINTAVADQMPLAFYWEVYSNELNDGYTVPPGGDGDDAPVQGFYFIKPDGTPATAWKTYRGLIAQSDPSQATSGAIERNLKMAYATNFTAPGATLGSAWSTSTFGGAMSVGISNNQLQMTVLNGTNTPYAQATLNIDSVLGRGLAVGEYLQFNLNRQNDAGTIGLSAFGLNHGSAPGAGSQTFQVYENATYGWLPVSYTASNNGTPVYNFDSASTTLGLRLTSADGAFATIAYYVDGTYSGSWLYKTTSTALDTFSFLAQSNVTNAVFDFNNLAIYTTNGNLAATNYVWDPAHNHTGSGGAGTWDAGTTGNFYNGSSDVVWNYATQGDKVSFNGTGGTVTVASAGVNASTMVFNSPNYVVSGGPITMYGNQTINASNGQVTINSVIAGSNGLTVTGAGSVVLAGTNTFTNGLYVNSGGTASFAGDANLGAAGQQIVLDGGTLNYTGTNAPTITRQISFGPNGGTIDTVNTAGTGKLVLNAADQLQGSGTITKTGPGWLTLYGSNSGTLTGNWNVNAGVIEVDSNTVLGSGSVTINSGGELASSAQVLPNNFVLSGGVLGADNGTGTYNGAINITAPSSLRLGNFWNTTSQSVNINGNITGSGSLTTISATGANSSTGTLTLAGNDSAWSGSMVVAAGTVSFSAGNNIGSGGFTLNGGTLYYTGTTAPTLAGSVSTGTNGGTINLVNTGATGKIALTGAISGSGNVTKTGPGWMSLYGTGTSTGNWTVSGGAIEVGAATALGSGTVTVNSGAEVSINTTTAVSNPVVANTGSTISADFNSTSTGTYSGPITAAGNFNVRLGNFWSTTSQNVTFTGNLTGAGSLTTINAAGAGSSTGVLTLGANNSTYSGNINIPTGTVATSPAAVGDNDALGTGTVTLSGGKLALKGQTTPSGTPSAIAPVTTSGYTIDTIYASSETSKYPSGNNTNNTLMDGSFSFFQNGYTPPAGSLNAGTSLTGGIASTSVTSAVTNPLTGTHTPFTLQSFTASNDLQILQGSTGTMTLSSPTAYANLSVLADASWGADASPNLKITFADGTTVNTTYKAYDWSLGTDTTKKNADAFGTTGVNRYSPTQSPGWDTGAFGMYETDIDLTNIGGVNYSYKRIASLTFTADTSDPEDRGRTNIFAVSGSARTLASGGPYQSFNNNVTVTASSDIDVSGSLNAYLGNLTIGTDTLTVSSADTTSNPYSLNFQSETNTGSPTFTVLNSAGGGHGTLNIPDNLTGYPDSQIAGAIAPAATQNSSTVFQKLTVTSGTVGFIAHDPSALPGVTVVSALSLQGTGTIDLNNNDLVVQNGSLADISAEVKSGQSTGQGIISSDAASDPTGFSALGVMLNKDDNGRAIYNSFDGQSVTPNDVLVMYTTYGDANLSGTVSGTDFAAIDNGFVNHLTGWQNGDFNNDGVVDGSDFALMDNAFDSQYGMMLAQSAGVAAIPTDQISGTAAAVPEPAGLTLLAIGGATMLSRRRRQRIYLRG